MPSGQDLVCQTIYEYFEALILTGRFGTGERLPSIQEIAKAFQLAPETVRSALLLLAQSGYIRMEAKLGSWVLYHEEEKVRRENCRRYYAQRYEGISDLFLSGSLLLHPILDRCLSMMDEDGWTALSTKWSSPPESSIIPESIQLYAQILSVLNNSLILNLFWEVSRYLRFSYLSGWDVVSAMNPILQTADRSAAVRLFQTVTQKEMQNYRSSFLEMTESSFRQFPDVTQIPFVWTIYRQRRQLCYTLAARIIREIAAGTYPVGSFLPPLTRMMKELDVSLSTLRRTLSLLSSLGVTCSMQGKGTLVCEKIENIEFSRPEIREGLRYYWESLQFAALTAKPVTLSLLEAMGESERSALTDQFRKMCRLNTCHRCFDIMLNVIVKRHPRRMVRECYGKIQEFLAWGYPFTVHRLHSSSLQAEYAGRIQLAAACLAERDWTGFADHFEALMQRETKLAEKILTDFCVSENGRE